MDLAALRDLLVAEPFQATLEPATDELPADRLTVALVVEQFASPLQLQIIRVPKAREDEMPGVELVQFYVPIPIEVTEVAAEEVRRLLPALNLDAPLMGFNYHEVERFVYFRYVLLVPTAGDVSRVLVETVWLIYFICDHLGAAAAAVAAGATTAAQVLADD